MNIERSIGEAQKQISDYKSKNPNKRYSDITDSAGNQYIDLVMEGGGVLGIALVGYTYALEQVGIRFWRIGGASAGAINALLLAAVCDVGQEACTTVLKEVAALDFHRLIDGGWTAKRTVDNVVLGSGIKRGGWAALLSVPLLRNLRSNLGMNPGDEFEVWINEVLERHGGIRTNAMLQKRLSTFPELWYRSTPAAGPVAVDTSRGSRLMIIASDVTTETKVTFPSMAPMYWKNYMDISPSKFVRASMSIPLFFEPFAADDLPEKEEARKQWSTLAGFDDDPPRTIHFIDGGIMSNFPINLFHQQGHIPRAPTFGARLSNKTRTINNTNTLMGTLGAIFDSSRHTQDFDFLMTHPDYKHLITFVETGDSNWLNFNLGDDEKERLFLHGVHCALTFLDSFDWDAYKQLRIKQGDSASW